MSATHRHILPFQSKLAAYGHQYGLSEKSWFEGGSFCTCVCKTAFCDRYTTEFLTAPIVTRFAHNIPEAVLILPLLVFTLRPSNSGSWCWKEKKLCDVWQFCRLYQRKSRSRDFSGCNKDRCICERIWINNRWWTRIVIRQTPLKARLRYCSNVVKLWPKKNPGNV